MEINEHDLRLLLNDTEKKTGCTITGPSRIDKPCNWKVAIGPCKNISNIDKCMDAVSELCSKYKTCVFADEK